MIFAQLTYREGVRAIESSLNSQRAKLYHMGIRWIEKLYKLYPINDIPFDKIKEEAGDDAFVVGYPFFETPYLQMPIWKKASIASEPDINIEQLPKFFIDTATRPGLSGSPVIMRRIGLHGLTNGQLVDSSIIGEVRKFIGIYSGRVGDGEVAAQLGIVWKDKVIDEIIDSIA